MNTEDVRGDVYRAISDPTRRALLDLLSRGEQPVKNLQGSFNMTQPALSQHLRVLREAGLVVRRRAGREQLYRANPSPLQEVAEWIAPYEHLWRDRIRSLREHLERNR